MQSYIHVFVWVFRYILFPVLYVLHQYSVSTEIMKLALSVSLLLVIGELYYLSCIS